MPPFKSFKIESPEQYLILGVILGVGFFTSIVLSYMLRIMRQLRRQADLTNLSREAIIVVNPVNDEILFWNFGAELMYGYTTKESIGTNIHTLLNTKFLTPLEDIKHELEEKGVWEGEFIQTREDGKQIYLSSQWQSMKNEGKKSVSIVQMYADITKQKSLERRKDEFLSIASHELKTPVTSIKAFTQILESRFKKVGDTTSASYLSKMNMQINRLTSLVNDLLDSTRIQAGKLQLNIELFRMLDLVDEVIENIQLSSEKHKIIREGNTREMVWADRNRTEQVLVNLINNAIKYSPRSDKIIVHISEELDFIKVGVEDQGIGIPKDKISKIFDRFYRVESKEGEFTGLGLGLYISSEIIKRQGGQMWVESEEKIGSIFYFTVPVKKIN
jgi:PAS domain S-box-containing protein